jgi:hypothetical protein
MKTSTKTKTVLKGKEWSAFLRANNFLTMKQEDVYVETHKYHAIYKVGGYYFTFAISRGYLNKSRLKSIISEYTA